MEREKALGIAKIVRKNIIDAIEDIENAAGTMIDIDGDITIRIDAHEFQAWELEEVNGK